VGGGAGLAELVADVRGCPGGFDGVGVAQVQQLPVGHAAITSTRPAAKASLASAADKSIAVRADAETNGKRTGSGQP
jgi:hypothetical protein